MATVDSASTATLAAEEHAYKTEESNALVAFLESNAILNIAIAVSYIGVAAIIWLCYIFYLSSAFWHLCILSVLMGGLSAALTMYD